MPEGEQPQSRETKLNPVFWEMFLVEFTEGVSRQGHDANLIEASEYAMYKVWSKVPSENIGLHECMLFASVRARNLEQNALEQMLKASESSDDKIDLSTISDFQEYKQAKMAGRYIRKLVIAEFIGDNPNTPISLLQKLYSKTT